MIEPINNLKNYLKSMERKTVLFIALLLLCIAGAAGLLRFYFDSYNQPYMMKDVTRLSAGWRYSVNGSEPVELKGSPVLNAGETLTMYRTLTEDIAGAAVMVRANHQTVNVYLDDNPLYLDRDIQPGENPGMALHFSSLPEDYLNRTLRIELTSPYALYSGRTGAVLMGTVTSLEAFALSQSMRSIIMMAMCLLLGIAVIALTLMQALRGERRPENLAIGVFALIWSLYWVCTEYVVFQFFTPFWMSTLSLGLYFSFQAPLALFFYFSFQRYKKWMLPAVVLHTAFPAAAILLQAFGVVDLPRLVTLNNIFLAGLAYTLVLSVLEAVRQKRVMAVASAFLALSYISMLFNFYTFYTRHGVPPYSYKETYFLLLLCVLVYNIQHFFSSYYRNLQENERISAELNVASRIQSAMLPFIFPPFPDRDEFDICASMIPAKEVGGDFYDFFFIDKDTLAITVADVSDKGVPAALFMVIAKTLIKNNAGSGKSPKEVFEAVNEMLCEGNEANMFVTAFLGYLHIPGGRFTYVNAGHNPPFVKRKGTIEKIKSESGFVLALMKGMKYTEGEITLRAGDGLFLYTDGVTEAMNRNADLFSASRLHSVLNQYKDLHVNDLLISVKKEIDLFAGGAEQADDITMLALRYNGIEKETSANELSVEAKLENMEAVKDFVDARITDCSTKARNHINIAVDEIFSNIARYAYHPGTGGVTVSVFTDDDDITVTFEDSGMEYDPLSREDPEVSLPPDERTAGGLGIFMVKNIMDSVEYRREGDKNILTVKKRKGSNADETFQ